MKTLLELLTSKTVKPYLDKAHQLTELNEIWSQTIDEWQDHCQITNFEKGKLTLHVKNAAMATRLHYAIPEIIKRISDVPEFKKIKKIRCKVHT